MNAPLIVTVPLQEAMGRVARALRLSIRVPPTRPAWAELERLKTIDVQDELELDDGRLFTVTRVLQRVNPQRLLNDADARGIGGVWSGTFKDTDGEERFAVLKLTTRDEVRNHLSFAEAYPDNVPIVYHVQEVLHYKHEKASHVLVMELVDATWLYDEKHVAALHDLVASLVRHEREALGERWPTFTDLHGDNVLFRRDDGRAVLIDFDPPKRFAGVEFFAKSDGKTKKLVKRDQACATMFWKHFLARCIDGRDIYPDDDAVPDDALDGTIEATAEVIRDEPSLLPNIMLTMEATMDRVVADAPPASANDDSLSLSLSLSLSRARRWWFRRRFSPSYESIMAYLALLTDPEVRRADASVLPFALAQYEGGGDEATTLFESASSVLTSTAMNGEKRATFRRLHVGRTENVDRWTWCAATYIYCANRLEREEKGEAAVPVLIHADVFKAFSVVGCRLEPRDARKLVPLVHACVDELVALTPAGRWPGDCDEGSTRRPKFGMGMGRHEDCLVRGGGGDVRPVDE